ncbi:hypothetical protein BH11ARM2_BH11ARM2_23360 [soil metagenome]
MSACRPTGTRRPSPPAFAPHANFAAQAVASGVARGLTAAQVTQIGLDSTDMTKRGVRSSLGRKDGEGEGAEGGKPEPLHR